MALMTVSQFATELKMPAPALLEQLAKAGVSKQESNDSLSEQDKTRLLDYLRKSHGDTVPKAKITLTRKQTSEIRASDSTGKARTIQVEVLKKRVFVKRDPSELAAEAAASAEAVVEAPVEVPVPEPVAVVVPEPVPAPVPEVVAAPVVAGRTVLAAILGFSRRPFVEAWMVGRLEAFANQAALSLEAAEHIERLRRAIRVAVAQGIGVFSRVGGEDCYEPIVEGFQELTIHARPIVKTFEMGF